MDPRSPGSAGLPRSAGATPVRFPSLPAPPRTASRSPARLPPPAPAAPAFARSYSRRAWSAQHVHPAAQTAQTHNSEIVETGRPSYDPSIAAGGGSAASNSPFHALAAPSQPVSPPAPAYNTRTSARRYRGRTTHLGGRQLQKRNPT